MVSRQAATKSKIRPKLEIARQFKLRHGKGYSVRGAALAWSPRQFAEPDQLRQEIQLEFALLAYALDFCHSSSAKLILVIANNDAVGAGCRGRQIRQ